MNICKRCGKEFEITKGLINFCSLKCRNSQGPRTEEFKNSVRLKAIGRKVSEETKNKIRGDKNPSYKGELKYQTVNCMICDSKFKSLKSKPKKTCSEKCRIIASTNRSYRNGSRKTFYYNGVILESTWELEIAKLLDSKKIYWIRPKPISWVDSEGRDRVYYPDFYLSKFDVFLDPKNPNCMEKDIEKMSIISKNINVVYGDINLIKKYINDILIE